MLLPDPPENDAVRALYEQARVEDGYVMNLARAWAWRPDVYAAFSTSRRLLAAQTTLSKREIAVLNAATASRRADSYCALAWGSRLAELADADTAAALLRGEDPPLLSERERALVRWAEAVVRNPSGTSRDDVDALRSCGLSDAEIADATLFVAFRLAFTAFNGALGAQPDRELADAAPEAVVASIPFGRAIDSAQK